MAHFQPWFLYGFSIWVWKFTRKTYKGPYSYISSCLPNYTIQKPEKLRFITERWTFSNWRTNWGRQIWTFLWVPLEETIILHMRFHFWLRYGLSWKKSHRNPQKWPLVGPQAKAPSLYIATDPQGLVVVDFCCYALGSAYNCHPYSLTNLVWTRSSKLLHICISFHSEPIGLWVDYKAQEMALVLASDIWFLFPS